MKLQESGEMYLETILVLSKDLPVVRAIDISEAMNYSKPSVSRAIKLLKQDGLIDVSNRGYITLTEEGSSIADKIYERHIIITQLLTQLGVSADIAASDACKIEHIISDESFEALKKYIKAC